MKNLLLSVMILILLVACNSNGQPKADYEVYGTVTTGASSYKFFVEKKPVSGVYTLTQGMDYLAPNVSALQVGSGATPVFTVNLVNDGSEYKVGVVAVNAAGFYSGLGTAIGTVGTVPAIPGGVGFRKK